MAVGCCAKCAKFLLIGFNFVFWLSGCALLALGVYLIASLNHLMLSKVIMIETGDELLKYLAYVLIGLGCLILLVGFCGCCGAIKESKCLLISYFMFLFIVLAAQLGVGIYTAMNQSKVMDEISMKLKDRFQDTYGREGYTDAVDFAQIYLGCCGIDGSDDYANSTWRMDQIGGNKLYPLSCCILSNKDESDSYKNPIPKNTTLCESPDYVSSKYFRQQTGCKEKLLNWFKEQTIILIAIGCGVPGIEIFGMILTICLCVNIGGDVS
ncbi:TSPAN8 (predicted) [Pycnogonum litorale]